MGSECHADSKTLPCMNIIRGALPFFLPLIETLFLKVGLAFGAQYLVIVLGGAVVSDALLTFLFKKNIPRMKIIWYALPSLLLYCSSAASLFIVEESYLRNAIVITNAAFQCLYLLNLYFLLYRREQYQERSFWHITATLNVLSFLNSSIVVYGLIHFVEYKLTLLVIPLALLTTLFHMQQLVSQGFDIRQYWRFIGIQMLIIIECAFAIHWFPSHFITKGFFLTIPFFMANQIGYSMLRKEQSSRSILSIIAIAASMLLLVLLTSRWR